MVYVCRECHFGPCCARTRRFAVERISEDSGYESIGANAEDDSSTDSVGGDIALADDGDSGEDDGWQTQSSGGASSFRG